MYFKDEEHRKEYEALLKKVGVNERSTSAALYVLSATRKSIQEYIQRAEIDFYALLEAAEIWSSGEIAMAKLAAALFCPVAWPVTVDDVFHSLDGENTKVALEALKMKYKARDF